MQIACERTKYTTEQWFLENLFTLVFNANESSFHAEIPGEFPGQHF